MAFSINSGVVLFISQKSWMGGVCGFACGLLKLKQKPQLTREDPHPPYESARKKIQIDIKERQGCEMRQNPFKPSTG